MATYPSCKDKDTYLVYETKLIGKESHNYIGKTHLLKHQAGYVGEGTAIINAVNKYGKESFTCEILEGGLTEEEAYQKEIEWIAKKNPYYNIQIGGQGDRGGLNAWKKGNIPWNTGKAGTYKLKPQSISQRKHLSALHKGKGNPAWSGVETETIVEAVLSCGSVNKASKVVGLSVETLWKRFRSEGLRAVRDTPKGKIKAIEKIDETK